MVKLSLWTLSPCSLSLSLTLLEGFVTLQGFSAIFRKPYQRNQALDLRKEQRSVELKGNSEVSELNPSIGL